MNLENLRTFLSLAETGNFHRTSDQMFTSQSTITFRINELEREIGCKLFDRTPRSVTLTPAGTHFRAYAQSIIDSYDTGLKTTAMVGRYEYSLSIGAPESFWTSTLLPSLDSYFQKHQDISFNLYSDNSWVINPMLLEDKLDLVISFNPIHNSKIEVIPLLKNPYILVAGSKLQLDTEMVTPSTITRLPFIHCRWGTTFDQWLAQNYKLNTHFMSVEKVSLFLHMLEKQPGIGFIPLRIAMDHLKSGALKELPFQHSETVPLEEIYIMFDRRKEKRIRPLVDAIRKYIDRIHLGDAFYRSYHPL